MKTNKLWILVVSAGLISACATTAPPELVHAREAYQTASAGTAPRVAPVQLHLASEALVQAERSFEQDPDSYKTLDLAYVAQRKAQIAEITAAIAIEQEGQSRAGKQLLEIQGNIVDETKSDLRRTRDDLAASKQNADAKAQDLSQTRSELAASKQNADARAQDLTQTRSELAASKHSGDLAAKDLTQARAALVKSERQGDLTAQQLSTERQARAEAEDRAAVAQAALAKLAAVKDEPRGMVITLSGSVLFASSRSVLLPQARTSLDRVAEVLLTTRERNLVIEGHTDSRGSDGHNQQLSQDRANSVRAFLLQRGYEADRIKAVGMGEGHPVADNGTAAGRANNRRVEIIIAKDGYTSSR